MKTMLRAAIMVVSIGTSSAYACDGDTYSATRLLTSIPSEQSSLAIAAPGRWVTVQVDGVARSYATTSRRSTWLFPPTQDSGEH